MVLTSSPLRLATAFLSALIALALGTAVLALNGLNVATVVLAAVCLVIATAVVVDYPISATFDCHGIVRRSLLRQRRCSWASVETLVRSRTRRRPALDPKAPLPPATGGLIAVRTARLWLCDRAETPAQFERIRELARDAGVEVRAEVVVGR